MEEREEREGSVEKIWKETKENNLTERNDFGKHKMWTPSKNKERECNEAEIEKESGE